MQDIASRDRGGVREPLSLRNWAQLRASGGESVFSMSVAPGRSTTLQWVALHSEECGRCEPESVGC